MKKELKVNLRLCSKLVEYLGNTISVPKYIKWIAIDENGSINGFKNKPKIDVDGGYWEASLRQNSSSYDQDYIEIDSRLDYFKRWAETLRAV